MYFCFGKKTWWNEGPCSQDVALGDMPYRSGKTMHHNSLCKGSEPWFEFLGLFVFQKQSHQIASWKPYSSAGFLKTQPRFDQKVLKSANLLTNPTNVYTFKVNPKPSAFAWAGILLWEFIFFPRSCQNPIYALGLGFQGCHSNIFIDKHASRHKKINTYTQTKHLAVFVKAQIKSNFVFRFNLVSIHVDQTAQCSLVQTTKIILTA